jgi:hypothetical protein
VTGNKHSASPWKTDITPRVPAILTETLPYQQPPVKSAGMGHDDASVVNGRGIRVHPRPGPGRHSRGQGIRPPRWEVRAVGWEACGPCAGGVGRDGDGWAMVGVEYSSEGRRSAYRLPFGLHARDSNPRPSMASPSVSRSAPDFPSPVRFVLLDLLRAGP